MGIPKPVVDRLNEAVRTVLANKAAVAAIEAGQIEVAYQPPADFLAYMAAERAKWADVLRNDKIAN